MGRPALTDGLLSELNGEQRLAAEHGDGPLLILAGAGTGKTTTLAHRVAHLIARGANPGRILLLTFSRRAAAEMLRRVAAILRRVEGSRDAGRRVWGGTFHAVATRILRLHGKAVGLDPAFTIHDRADSEDLMNVLRAELGLAEKDRRMPRKATCMAIYSRCVNARARLEPLLAEAYPWCRDTTDDLRELFVAYVDRKQQQNVLDYDDLLLFLHALLDEPVAAAAVRARFDHVLVDEYQDTNALQAEILAGLRPDGRCLTVVGDDAQSIYSFRAATVRNILDFPGRFSGVTVLPLQTNYRSTPPLVAATNRVIALAAERHEKELRARRVGGGRPTLLTCRDEDEQTEFVVRRILEHREQGIDLNRQAVLFRASHHSLELELELARRNIPFHKYGGLKFVEATHVKDLVAFLRLAENPRDTVSGTRALLLLPRVGPATAQRLMQVSLVGADRFDAWARVASPTPDTALWADFVSLLRDLSAPQPPELPVQVHRVRELYARLVEERWGNLDARMADLEQIEQLAARHPNRGAFLADLTLDPPASTQELAGPPALDDDWLVLSTIHSAKGLEWDAVFVIHAADGNIPSDLSTGSAAQIEEERRLFYVALTRARDHLCVSFPLRYYHHRTGDPHSYAQLTRFLPADVRGLFDEITTAGDEPAEPQSPAAQTGVADVRSRIRAMWT